MQEIQIVGMIFLVLLGAVFLFMSLFPVRNVSGLFPKGKLKTKWDMLSTLVVCFILGYLYFAYDYWHHRTDLESVSFVVPVIFFFGGVFVYVVGKLADQSAKDIKKIALLQHESITDPLMQINNRRHFDKRVEEERNIALRYGLPLSVLLIDVDNFKNINDTFGHIVGDEVLRNLAKEIKVIARESDIVARYGGEEVAVIAPSTSKDKARQFAERMRSIIEKSVIALNCATQEEIKITVSIGVSDLDLQKKECCTTLVQKVDEALYEAKRLGKNRVEVQ